ncbi:fra a 1-associated protein [Salvia divinorum]|uniref:Fra a 1-associated protein n=1 Tax=Salvia divinorum TaxID=28513 RepID=A0ABD1GBI1_SALDI
MGWLSKNGDFGYNSSSSGDASEFHRSSGAGDNTDRCATRKVVRSQCRTEEVEPGKFVRKCEKTEQIFKDCVGRPTEMVESNKEYTEEDVSDQMVKGSFSFKSTEPESTRFPGLRSDIEAIERNLFGSINRFFEAADEVKNDFFSSIGVPGGFDKEFPPSERHSIPIENSPPKEAIPNGEVDLSGLARDV